MAAIVSATVLAALVWFIRPHLAWQPNTGPGIFDSPVAFEAYVAGLRLDTSSLEGAADRLRGEGFQCDLLEPGNMGCYRRREGSSCGERQFVDLHAGAGNAGALSVKTRFGLACK